MFVERQAARWGQLALPADPRLDTLEPAVLGGSTPLGCGDADAPPSGADVARRPAPPRRHRSIGATRKSRSFVLFVCFVGNPGVGLRQGSGDIGATEFLESGA